MTASLPQNIFFAIVCCLLGFAPSAWAQGAALGQASPQQKKDATESYTQGMAKFETKNFGPAMADFEQSYNAIKSPNALLMVARTLVELGQLSEGYRQLVQTEAEAKEAKKLAIKYEATEIAAREERLELQKKLGMLKLSVTGAKPGDKILLEGRELVAADWAEPVPVMPGAVEVTLMGEQGTSKKTIQVSAGGTATLELAAPVAPPPPTPTPSVVVEAKLAAPPSRTLLYVSGGVGLAGLATFAVFGASSNSKYSDLENACPSQTGCAADLRSKRDDGVSAQTIANVGLMFGIFGASAATFFYLSEDEAEPPSAHGIGLSKVEVGFNSVSVSGRF